MSVESIRRQIENQEDLKSNRLHNLSQMRERIVGELKLFVNNELKAIVEQYVKSSSEHTKSLDSEKLSEMKKTLTIC